MATLFVTPFKKIIKDQYQAPAGLLEGSDYEIATSGTSARNSTAFAADVEAVVLFNDTACYIKLGDSGVTASSGDYTFYLPASTPYTISIENKTHLAAIEA